MQGHQDGAPPTRPPVRHPMQVSSFGAFAALGAGWLLTRPTQAVESIMPDWMLMVWNMILVAAGVLGIASALLVRHSEAASLLSERIALLGLCGYCVIDVIALLDRYGSAAWASILIFVFIGIGAGWRLWQVQQRVSWMRRPT